MCPSYGNLIHQIFFFLNLGMRINDEKELLRDWLKVPVLENYFHLIFQDQI